MFSDFDFEKNDWNTRICDMMQNGSMLYVI